MNGFRLVVPAGWLLLDLTADHDTQVASATLALVEGVPTAHRSAVRAVVAESLTKLTTELAAGGASALVVQTEGLQLHVSLPILVVRPFVFPDGVEPLAALLALVAQDDGATLFDLPTMVAVRTRTEAVADRPEALASVPDALVGEFARDAPARERAAAALRNRRELRVRYLLGLPDDASSWVELFGSVQATETTETEALLDAYAGLFDELVRGYEGGVRR